VTTGCILLPAEEAAAVLGVPVATLVSWAVRGKVEKHRTPDGRALYDLATLDSRDRRLGAPPRPPSDGPVCFVVLVPSAVAERHAVRWPAAIQEAPWAEPGTWAEWVTVRDELPPWTCTPSVRRDPEGWTLAGQWG
jgi:hypothetical protein